MKRKIILGIVILGILSGCTSTTLEADTVLLCYLSSTVDEQTYVSNIEIQYEEESGQLVDGLFEEKYSVLVKNETNNLILADLIDRQTKMDGLSGLIITLNIEELSFEFIQEWDYTLVEIDDVQQADEIQSKFIKNGEYSHESISEYYRSLGYSCFSKEIE